MRWNIALYLVGHRTDVRRVLKSRQQCRSYIPQLVLLRLIALLFAVVAELHALEVPNDNLTIDGARNDDVGILGVELECVDFEGGLEDEQMVDGVPVFVAPEEYVRLGRLH